MPALNLTAGSTVTLDESANLQNLAATPAVAGDSNDNDISASSLPTAFSSRLAAQSVGTAINAALSGYDGTNAGTNAFTFSVTGAVTDISFTDANGAPLNGFDSGLNTADGEDIFLYTDPTNNNVVYGKTALNVVVFAAYLEETGTPVSGAKRYWRCSALPPLPLRSPFAPSSSPGPSAVTDPMTPARVSRWTSSSGRPGPSPGPPSRSRPSR